MAKLKVCAHTILKNLFGGVGAGGGGDLIGLIAKVELPNYKIPNSKSLKLSLSFLLLDCLEFACVADALNLLYRANNLRTGYTNGLDEYVGRLQRRLSGVSISILPLHVPTCIS